MSLGFSLYLFIPQIFIQHLVDTILHTWKLSINKNVKDLCPYGALFLSEESNINIRKSSAEYI